MSKKFFAIEKFAEYSETLNGIAETMPIKRRAVDIYRQKNNIQRAKDMYSDLEELKKQLLETVGNLSLLFDECVMPECSAFSKQLFGAVLGYNLMTPDYAKLVSAVKVLIKQIPKSESVGSDIVGRLMNNVKMGYYPTDISHVEMIKSALKFPECRVNVLDPYCGEGIALEALTKDTDSATYGTEIDHLRGKEAESRLDRVGFGSFFHSRISTESFHALFLNPPYLNVIGEGGIRARSEKRFLVESMHHLLYGGVIMYIIPYYRLTYDICRVLCDNFRDISVYRFLNDEFEKFRQIVVFGIRKKRDDCDDEAKRLSQYAMLPDKIPSINTLKPESYPVPCEPKKVEIFKGAEFNVDELKRQLAKSKSVNMFFEKSRIDAMEKRPLLPLNIGQVGLIGGSGLINGYVDCEYPHIIKGRIIKEVNKYEDKDAQTLTEIRVNRMLFNVLTPDGLKRLA